MVAFCKNKRGYTLVGVIVAVTLITTLVASYVSLFNGMLTSTTYFRDNMTAQMLAVNRWKDLEVIGYASLTNEPKTAVGSTGFQREVILGTEEDLGGGAKRRDITINIYKSGNATPLYTAPKSVNSQGIGGSTPSGGIIMWSGSIATIPNGWALCDGTNGTPDLRNRFVVAAGSDPGVGYTPSTTEAGSGIFRVGDHGGQGLK